MELLKEMCAIHAPAGNEVALKDFILKYIETNKSSWDNAPEIYEGEGFQDCIILKFGAPTTAIFAHMDSIGFTVKYGKELVKIGGPVLKEGIKLVGKDSQGPIETELIIIEHENGSKSIEYLYDREIDRGTELVFKPEWREDSDFVQCCYMDNRLGVWNALKVAETLKDGVICFSCWEEHGGGSVGYLAKFIYENWKVKQGLISDITWVTEGVQHGKGVAVSMRDSGIPRRSYLNKIRAIAEKNDIEHQLEVEGSGGSDGNQLQNSPYPFDWLFVGAPEDHVHSPDEKVHKSDIASMLELYRVLMKEL
jgi:putative aminopeptidase FrvX